MDINQVVEREPAKKLKYLRRTYPSDISSTKNPT
jgi:hypothetical protein